MDHEVRPWKMAFFQSSTSWSNIHGPIFFKKNQYTKPLGPSLGVNQMWTKENDHAPKNECADFF